MPRISAGLLMYRIQDGTLQVLLAHPGGPYFKNKDDGYWTIPKGEIEPGEDLLEAAKREFTEETGVIPSEPFIELTPIKQKGGQDRPRLGVSWRLRSRGNCQQHDQHRMAPKVRTRNGDTRNRSC